LAPAPGIILRRRFRFHGKLKSDKIARVDPCSNEKLKVLLGLSISARLLSGEITLLAFACSDNHWLHAGFLSANAPLTSHDNFRDTLTSSLTASSGVTSTSVSYSVPSSHPFGLELIGDPIGRERAFLAVGAEPASGSASQSFISQYIGFYDVEFLIPHESSFFEA